MKEAPAVAAARQAAEAKKAEIDATEARLVELRSELSAAYRAIEDAQDAEDSALPQCRMVTVRWRTGKPENPIPMAILRKTPANQIVVRRRGAEHRFKWDPRSERYVQVAKPRFFMDDTRELRNVPAEFLPKEPAHG